MNHIRFKIIQYEDSEKIIIFLKLFESREYNKPAKMSKLFKVLCPWIYLYFYIYINKTFRCI